MNDIQEVNTINEKSLYVINDNKIIKGVMTRYSKKGNIMIKFDNQKNERKVSPSKIFDNIKDAEEFLKQKRKQIEKYYKIEKEIDEVLNKIYEDFTVDICFLNRPCNKNDAWDMYYEIRDRGIRHTKI